MNYWPASGGGADDLMRQHFVGQLDAVLHQIERVRAAMTTPEGPPDWAIDNLRRTATSLGDGLDEQLHAPLLAELRPRIDSLRAEGLQLANAADIRSHADYLRCCHEDAPKSVVGARGTIEAIDESVARLRTLQAFDGELAAAARRGKEKAARYRWQKKCDDAEVAEAGGNAKKAAKLRAEGAVMLRQDWAIAFPGEAPPSP